MKSILKSFFLFILIGIIKYLPPKLSCYLNNFRQKIMGRDIFFFYDKDEKLFYVVEENRKVYFSEKIRGLQTYSYG